MGILRLILLLLLFTCTVVNHAQVRNNQGQKLVSRIEIENYHNKGYVKQRVNITYNYDVSKHLQDVTRTVVYNDEGKDIDSYKRNHTLKDVVTKRGRSLTRKTYFDNRLNREFVYRYVMNEQGFITERDEATMLDTGDSIKKRTQFHYLDGENKLAQIERCQWVWKKGDRKWYKPHDYTYINFGYKDGDCYWAMMHSSNYVIGAKNNEGERIYYGGDIDYKDGMFSKQIDDTNINLNLFVAMLCWEICLDEHEFELSTEWLGMKSKHIVAASGQNSLDFKTSVKIDEKGNITELVVRYQNEENPTKKIKIYYVM